MSYTGWKPENDKTVSGLCQGDPNVRITGSSVWTGSGSPDSDLGLVV